MKAEDITATNTWPIDMGAVNSLQPCVVSIKQFLALPWNMQQIRSLKPHNTTRREQKQWHSMVEILQQTVPAKWMVKGK